MGKGAVNAFLQFRERLFVGLFDFNFRARFDLNCLLWPFPLTQISLKLSVVSMLPKISLCLTDDDYIPHTILYLNAPLRNALKNQFSLNFLRSAIY